MATTEVIGLDEMAERPPQITVVLTPELVERLRAAATRKGVKPSVLLRMWAIEKLDQEERER